MTIDVNTHIVELNRPWNGELTKRLPMTLRMAMVHELGHAWTAMFYDVGDGIRLAGFGGERDLSVYYEDAYRKALGLADTRLWHTPGTVCQDSDEHRAECVQDLRRWMTDDDLDPAKLPKSLQRAAPE